jgi:hypothetical protein
LFPYLIVFIALGVAIAAPAWGQQAIVNMPSADITPKGSHFLMHETQWRPWNPASYWYGTNFYAYGVGKNTELAVTTYALSNRMPANAAIGVGFKSSIPLARASHPDAEQNLTVGSMAVQSITGRGFGHFTYAHHNFRLPRVRTRLTAGGWAATANLVGKNTGGVLAGIEHPVNKRVILLAEWFQGRNDLGFFIPGVLFHPTPRQFIVVAYKIPNYLDNGRHGLVLEYGFTFGGPEEDSDKH